MQAHKGAGFVVCFVFAPLIDSALMWPRRVLGVSPAMMIAYVPLAPLGKALNLAHSGALVLTVAYAVNQIYAWGLRERAGFAKGSLNPVWPWTWVLFMAGAAFACGVVVPLKVALSGYEQHIVAATCVILWCAAALRLVHASVGRLKS